LKSAENSSSIFRTFVSNKKGTLPRQIRPRLALSKRFCFFDRPYGHRSISKSTPSIRQLSA